MIKRHLRQLTRSIPADCPRHEHGREQIYIKFYAYFIIIVDKYISNILSDLLFTQEIITAINTYDSPVGSIRKILRQGCFLIGQRVTPNLVEV
jgi:hypothetical protein